MCDQGVRMQSDLSGFCVMSVLNTLFGDAHVTSVSPWFPVWPGSGCGLTHLTSGVI